MPTLTPARWIAVLALLVAAGSAVAALNWYGTWAFFARLDVQSGQGVVSGATVEALANFQQWVLTAVICVVVCVAAIASAWLLPASTGGARRQGAKAGISAE